MKDLKIMKKKNQRITLPIIRTLSSPSFPHSSSIFCLLSSLFLACFPLVAYGQTIAEKKQGITYTSTDLSPDMQQFLLQLNKEQGLLQSQLKQLYSQVNVLYAANASPEDYKDLLAEINEVRAKMFDLDQQWHAKAVISNNEPYALWHQPNTTIGQLIIDYGAQDFIYLIPPDISAMGLSVDSNLPIPRSSWSDMMETILRENGVGIKQLNPYLRQLYLISKDRSSVKIITNQRQDLEVMPPNERVGFMLSPEPSDVRRVWLFLDKFINPNSAILQMIGRDILIVAQVSEVQELLKLYDFVSSNRGDKEYKVVALRGVDAEEISKILTVIFDQMTETPQSVTHGDKGEGTTSAPPSQESNGMKIIPLTRIAQAVFLVGTKEEIKKAEAIIREVEGQVGEAKEKIIFLYNVKHSEPEELAEVLSKIYFLMLANPASYEGETDDENFIADRETIESPRQRTLNVDNDLHGALIETFPNRPYADGFYLDEGFVVNPAPYRTFPPPNQNRDNFIVDEKSGSIVMVVEADILQKLKDLLRKIDVPKRMVQIEILLFEKTLSRETDFGLNLLQIGDAAKNIGNGAAFNQLVSNNKKVPELSNLVPGIFEFFFSHAKQSGIPAYDMIYKFLISQDDIQINASPSVLTLNQTLATVEIDEEISVNTGIYEVNTAGTFVPKNSFARARYGIKIGVTPTIHVQDFDDDCFDDSGDYITLLTDLTFQTIDRNVVNDRPDVTTRSITNEVRIPDGQTIILGGLRRKDIQDSKKSIPYLGELPGVGKLFSTNKMQDDSSEMFVFITPKIVSDPSEDLERIRMIEMARRPGDIPEFLCQIEHAFNMEKNRLMQGTMTILFGRPPVRCLAPVGEYDGECR